ncbi:hypothetical protein [uncultured Ruegeria sp.]|uniref:hypothetical protein n=1 Tax=uncultured Ruegeria sp. TaxID=259304 RepID=UPI0026249808|nr:hypothetical protein [uncultured Ruegeria sp.]
MSKVERKFLFNPIKCEGNADQSLECEFGRLGSEAELVKAQEFIEGTLLSRFDNPAEGRVVMVAQRLHEMDPPGYLLKRGTYRHLNLPTIAQEHETVHLGRGKVMRRKPGDLLCPSRLDQDTLDTKRREMGAVVFNCQYQQKTRLHQTARPCAGSGSVLTKPSMILAGSNWLFKAGVRHVCGFPVRLLGLYDLGLSRKRMVPA